jgi:hypothetical protein
MFPALPMIRTSGNVFFPPLLAVGKGGTPRSLLSCARENREGRLPFFPGLQKKREGRIPSFPARCEEFPVP